MYHNIFGTGKSISMAPPGMRKTQGVALKYIKKCSCHKYPFPPDVLMQYNMLCFNIPNTPCMTTRTITFFLPLCENKDRPKRRAMICSVQGNSAYPILIYPPCSST